MSEGKPPAASTSPSELAEPVSSKTSQPIAVCWRNVPLAETTWPAKYRRNGRRAQRPEGSLTHATGRCIARGAASGTAPSASRSMKVDHGEETRSMALGQLCERDQQPQDWMKASRSALMVSAWVVGMPCGKPG